MDLSLEIYNIGFWVVQFDSALFSVASLGGTALTVDLSRACSIRDVLTSRSGSADTITISVEVVELAELVMNHVSKNILFSLRKADAL